MNRPLDEFSGWLRFFQIIVFFNLTLNIFMGFTLFGELFREPDKLLTSGALLQWVFILYMFYSILKILENRHISTPEQIKEHLFYIFMVSIAHFIFHTAVTLLVYKQEWSDENLITLVGTIQNMIWAALWHTYFEKSKRVKAYYNSDDHNLDIRV
jgi:uncharacterized membrane protein YidH (DUF202 family)